MKVSHTAPQVEEIRAHISDNREAYLLGTGIVIGVCVARLLGRQQVVVHIINQGAPRG
jgi:hypothetical protein